MHRALTWKPEKSSDEVRLIPMTVSTQRCFLKRAWYSPSDFDECYEARIKSNCCLCYGFSKEKIEREEQLTIYMDKHRVNIAAARVR